MNIFLGDSITLTKEETIITGKVTGIVLDDKGELERIYLSGLDTAFWFAYDKWRVVDDQEEDEEDEL